MDFLFANPLFAWLLPAAGLPVLFHLFFKLKKRPRVFPTLMFFEQIDPKLSARRQIRQWLVLLLRTLFLLFLILALARPLWLNGLGTGSVAVVCVIDNSGSMSGPTKGDRTKLSAAIDAARVLIANLSAKDTAAVVTLVEDPTVTLPSGLNSDKTPLKAALDQILETEATGEPSAAVQRAFTLLQTSSATRFEVHLFTDLQEAKWNRPGAGLASPRTGTTIIVHRFSTNTAKVGNVSLMEAKVPDRRLIVGRPLTLQVALSNPSDLDVSIHLNWADDADNKGIVELAVPHQSEKNVPLLLKPATAGFHWAKIWIEGDGFDADNKAGVAFVCTDKSPVLLTGLTSEFGLLPLALSPAALSGLITTNGTVADIDRLKPVMVVTTWDAIDEELRLFVERGGNLLVIPGLGPVTSPDWLGVRCEPIVSEPKGASVIVNRPSSPLFADLTQPPFRTVKAFKFHPLQVANDQESIFSLEDGRSLLIDHKLGNGHIFASGLAFDPSWTTLPLKSSFLALAQGMALANSGASNEIVQLVAGQRLPPGGGEPVQIRSFAGSPLDWRGDGAHLPVLPRAGVYSFKTEKREHYLAVRSADKEGLMKFVTGDQAPVLAGLTHKVRDFVDIESFLKQTIRMNRGTDLFLPLLLLAIVVWLLEAWIANPPPQTLKSPSKMAVETRRTADVA